MNNFVDILGLQKRLRYFVKKPVIWLAYHIYGENSLFEMPYASCVEGYFGVKCKLGVRYKPFMITLNEKNRILPQFKYVYKVF